MVYADTDFFVALIKEDDRLQEKAEKVYREHQNDIETSLTTFIELCLLAEDYDWNLEKAFTSILQMAETDFDERVVYQALEYIDQGLNVFDSFKAAKVGDSIISPDKEFDNIGINRIKLEQK